VRALIVAALVLAAARAEAIPAFARKTGMGCPACHDSWARLNDFGELFRDRGYRVDSIADEPWYRSLDYVPISLRTSVGYQYTYTTNQAVDGGQTNISSGGFLFPALDLLAGTALADHFSVLIVASGFSRDGAVALESAWGRINDIFTSWLNLRLGKMELDLPLSEHRSFSLVAPYLIYHYHPVGSTNGFSMGDNQLAAEIMGHGKKTGFRYSVAVASDGGQPLASQWAFSAPTLYGHATYTMLPRSRILTRVRVGAVGFVGWWPTQFKMLTPAGGTPAPVPGTGNNHRVFFNAGGEVHLSFGPLSRPLILSAAWMFGQEDGAIVANGTQNAQWHGGFVELAWVPILSLTPFVRYDGVYNLQQADATQPLNSNDQTAFTIGIRYLMWQSPWGSLAGHAEVTTLNTENAAPVPVAPVRATTVFAGFDFAI
jgi:hypothetical protein